MNEGGDYQLGVTILGSDVKTVGYRVDPQKIKGKLRKRLLGSEGRKSLTVEVIFWQGDQKKHGPYRVTADADFDYVDGDSIQDLTFVDTNGTVQTILPFSLGQLEPAESAQEAAKVPIYRNVARKIVDLMTSNW